MTVPRQKFREAVFLALFGLDSEALEPLLVELIMEQLKMTKKNVYEALKEAAKIKESFASIDESIRLASTAYDFERIPQVERNILRLGVFEMQSLPPAVAMSEAMRLAEKFSTKEAASFVNAIMDHIHKHANR